MKRTKVLCLGGHKMKKTIKRTRYQPKYQPVGYKWLSIDQRARVGEIIRETIDKENENDLLVALDIGIARILKDNGLSLTPAAVAYYRGVVMGIPGSATRLRILLAKREGNK